MFLFVCVSDCTDEVTDIAVIMDISARIGAENLNKQTEAVVHLIKHANVAKSAVQFSITTFAEQYEPQVDFNHFYDGPSLISWINSNIRMVKESTSNISRALEYISSDGFTAVKGARTNSRKVVMLFSSGEVDDLTLVKAQSKLLKDAGYLVVTVGIGLEANYANLIQISSDPAFTFILGDEMEQEVDNLEALLSTLEHSLCSHI
jgi:uncharacterized protein YegL